MKTASGARSKPRDENVLFDADEELDEDDFGDFEVGDHSEQRQQHDIKRVNLSQGHAQSSQNQATILIDLEEQHMRGKETSTEGYPASFSTSTQKAPRRVLRFDQTFESDISEQKSIWPGNSTAAPSQVLQSDITQKDEDPWPESPDPSQEVESFSRVEDQNEAKALDRKASTSSSNMVKQLALPELLVAPDDLPASSPPTNIPPPVLLFGLFTPVFKLVQSKLFEPLSQHSSASPTRSSILSTDQTQRLLDSLLVVGVVLGHIIAGRKLRWKRDTILNQSMRIGPASASRSGGGMKLTSLDKGESAKEDRECAEAIAAWRSQAGRLRSAIGKESPMPEIGDTLPVRTAQAGEGAMASTKPCVLCGLKRHERVPTVDFNVQDSFGEWYGVSCFLFPNQSTFGLPC